MENFVFEIFPSRSLDQSVITTVWIGVMVFTFFNLRFGWTYSGIVVPGYLVPIIITRPVTAAIIIVESILTYWIAWFFSDFLARRGLWCNVFGRDRFFVIILCSVAVRLAFDGQILPELAGYLEKELSIQYDFHNSFQSLGLIINALIANYFWKSGVRKSLFPLIINVFTTYLIVRYLLMEHTNFNIGTLEYMYEGIAVSFAESPKAYIVLITVALFASKLNLYYGWEFSGILIPSLIALQWYEPIKIVFTFLEMIVIFTTASLILRMPFWQNRTIEKASKVFLFFNISFGYRMALGYFIEEVSPGVKISDFFAAGYLVATLMAVKIHEKNIAIRLSMVTIITSFAAAFVGNILGFLFFLLPPSQTKEISLPKVFVVEEPQKSLQKTLEKQQMLMYQNAFSSQKKISVFQRKTFSNSISEILLYIKTQEKYHLEKASVLLKKIHYKIVFVEKRYLFLQAKSKKTGTFVFDTQSPNDLHLETPLLYLHDFKTRDLAVQLWEKMNFRSLAIVSTTSSYSYHENFHKIVPNILQVKLAPRLSNELRVESVPANFNFASLKQVIGEYKIIWLTQKRLTQNNFLELFITPDTCLKALVKNLPLQSIKKSSRNLKTWLEQQKQKIPKRGSNLYKKAKIEDILFFDKVLITPLLKCIEHFDLVKTKFPPKYFQEILLIQKKLDRFGYGLVWFKGSDEYLVVYEKNKKRRRNWGTYVFRLGNSSPFVIQNPNPLFANCSFEFSVDLFYTINGKALFLSGAHPQTNEDGSSNFTDIKGKVSLFNLLYEAILRETLKPLAVVQTRGLKLRPDAPHSAEILLASSRGALQDETLSVFEKDLWNTLKQSELSVKLVDGSFEMAGYEINHLLQTKYLEQTQAKEFCVLWLSPLIHFIYKQQHDTLQKAQFRALGIKTIETDLFSFLQSLGIREKSSQIPNKLKSEIEKYLYLEDIVLLKKILKNHQNIQFFRVTDKGSRKAFLVISLNMYDFPLVVNLSKSPLQMANQVMDCRLDKKEVEYFTFSNFTWMRLLSK